MNDTIKLKEIILVPRAFRNEVIVKMWQAFRSEYIAFNSRDVFADHFYDCMITAENRYRFEYSKGQPLEGLKHPPTPQTLYNFFRSGLTDYKRMPIADGTMNVSASRHTLLMVFIFLVSISKDKVLSWIREKELATFTNISGLDESFVRFEPAANLPHVSVLYKIPETPTRTITAHMGAVTTLDFPSLDGKLELHSILVIAEHSNFTSLGCVIDANHWREYLQKANAELKTGTPTVDRFDIARFDAPTNATGFISKDLQVSVLESSMSGDSRQVRIDQTEKYVVIDMKNVLEPKRVFQVVTKILYGVPEDWVDFEADDFYSASSNFVKIHDPRAGKHFQHLIVQPPSPKERIAALKFCNQY